MVFETQVCVDVLDEITDCCYLCFRKFPNSFEARRFTWSYVFRRGWLKKHKSAQGLMLGNVTFFYSFQFCPSENSPTWTLVLLFCPHIHINIKKTGACAVTPNIQLPSVFTFFCHFNHFFLSKPSVKKNTTITDLNTHWEVKTGEEGKGGLDWAGLGRAMYITRSKGKGTRRKKQRGIKTRRHPELI